MKFTNVTVDVRGPSETHSTDYYHILDISFMDDQGRVYCGSHYKGNLPVTEWIRRCIDSALNDEPVVLA